MTNIKVIREKIDSIINTKKITRTMEMVAISKMKKAKNKLLIGKPYFKVINNVITHILEGHLKYKHIFLKKIKKNKNIGIIIVSTNRGLCGSLNANIFKLVKSTMSDYYDKKVNFHLYTIGEKGLLFFKNYKFCKVSKILNLKDNITELDLIQPFNKIFLKYKIEKIDKLFIISNKFKNNISQTPCLLQLLPIEMNNFKSCNSIVKSNWDYLYEPDSDFVLDILLKKYILFQVLQSISENILSEYAARMVAMKIASDNSNNMLKDLKLMHNKMRQFSITQELTEIVSGASIISKNE